MKKSTKRYRKLRKYHKKLREEQQKNCNHSAGTKKYIFRRKVSRIFGKKECEWETKYLEVCSECGAFLSSDIYHLEEAIKKINRNKKKRKDYQFIQLPAWARKP